MRSPFQDEVPHRVNLVRPVPEQHVDRPEVEAQQCVEPTGTNRPRAWICCDVRARYGGLGERRPCRPDISLTTVFGGHGGGETPVPIPNTAVKPSSADGTWRETAWESRSPPFSHSEGPSSDGPSVAFLPLVLLLASGSGASGLSTRGCSDSTGRGSRTWAVYERA